MLNYVRWITLTSTCLLVTLGCGGGGGDIETYPVTGQITFKGEPVTEGQVMFVPNFDAPTATAQITSDGKYTLSTYSYQDGAAEGSYRVAINVPVAQEEQMDNLYPEDFEKGGKAENMKFDSIIPDKYSSIRTSGLTAEVKAESENLINFFLEN